MASAKGVLSSDTRLPELGPTASGFTTSASPWVSSGPRAADTVQWWKEEEELKGHQESNTEVQCSELTIAGLAGHKAELGY